MSWPTGDSLSSALVAVRFLVPINDWVSQTLVGAPNYLQYSQSWDADGVCTPDQAAAAFARCFRDIRIEAVSTGQIVCFAADNRQYINGDPAQGPSQWLKCEGQDLSVVAYPDLYAVIGNTFGGDITHFYLPDLRGRVIVDAGSGTGLTSYTLGETFGEEKHQLTVLELASHNHTIPSTLTSLAVEPGDLPVLDPNVLPAWSGNAGGDIPHENRQPSMALFWYIQVFP